MRRWPSGAETNPHPDFDTSSRSVRSARRFVAARLRSIGDYYGIRLVHSSVPNFVRTSSSAFASSSGV